jgi:hypothetical protein
VSDLTSRGYLELRALDVGLDLEYEILPNQPVLFVGYLCRRYICLLFDVGRYNFGERGF